MIKFCRKCKENTERYNSGRCKPCKITYHKAWVEKNPERVKATAAAWSIANTERHKIVRDKWIAKNIERQKVNCAEWYKKNIDKSRADHKAWGIKNRDKKRDKNNLWRQANPYAIRVIKQNRRARELANGGVLSKGISDKLFKLQKGLCPCCGELLGNDFHLDHIMPLKLGGSNTDNNIQLLRAKCNLEKHTKHPVIFMQSRGFLL